VALLDDPPPPDGHELRASLRSFSWFLDRAGDGGIPLTAAGCLKPADVRAAAQVLPTMGDWIGEANRETHATPVLHFRKLLQSLGLLRKHKGALQRTRAGSDALQAPEALWNLLADKLAPDRDGFDTDATLLLLVYAATSAHEEIPLAAVAAALSYLGWRTGDGQTVERHDLYWLSALEVLRNVSAEQVAPPDRWRISPAAALRARAALRRRQRLARSASLAATLGFRPLEIGTAPPDTPPDPGPTTKPHAAYNSAE